MVASFILAVLIPFAWQLLGAAAVHVSIRPERQTALNPKAAARVANSSNASEASRPTANMTVKAKKASTTANASTASNASNASTNASNTSQVVLARTVASSSEALNKSMNASTAVSRSDEEKVTLDIYYETRCPLCQAFISNTLPLVWNDPQFQMRLKVHFYPYGNSQMLKTKDISPGYKFWHEEMDQEGIEYMFPCQHGPDECFGNMLQACAIELLQEQTKFVPFVICMESRSNQSLEMAAWDCGQEQQVDLVKVKECMRSSHGNRLMSKHGLATETLAAPAGPKGYVPWITINGVHTEGVESDFNGTRSLFMRTLCGAVPEPRPALCEGTTTPALLASIGQVQRSSSSRISRPLASVMAFMGLAVAAFFSPEVRHFGSA